MKHREMSLNSIKMVEFHENPHDLVNSTILR